MSTTRHRYLSTVRIDLMNRPWFIDVLTYLIAFVWMGWTFAAMQQHGPDPWLLASAVIVLAAALLLIYNQRLAYLRIGDYVVAESRGRDPRAGERDGDRRGDGGQTDHEREREREGDWERYR